jgi:hypothetical protein
MLSVCRIIDAFPGAQTVVGHTASGLVKESPTVRTDAATAAAAGRIGAELRHSEKKDAATSES